METKLATLAELNSRLERLQQNILNWSTLTLKREYMVTTMNRSFQGYHTSGSKLHLGIVETVVARSDEQRPGQVKVGDVFAVQPFCNGNGQRRGGPVRGQDTDAITCGRCLKALQHLTAAIQQEG